MIKQEIHRKIADFREIGIPDYVPREVPVHLAGRMVSTIVGARRAGKSFRSIQVADDLIAKGAIPDIRHVCPVDFDNPILGTLKSTELGQIESAFLEATPECDLKTPAVFILDEIHKIEGWESYVIDLSRNPNWKVVVTGSSSKLLRDEIATELRGKSVSSTVYPLSFKEFLAFRNFDHSPASTKGQAEAARLFDDYLTWGAYPAVVLADEPLREALLREYFDTMILRDVIQRYSVSKPVHCTQLYRHLLSNIAKPHTLQSAYAYLKQAGHATSRDSVRDYLCWAEDAWLMCTVPIYSHSRKDQERNYKKVYCIDWALAVRNSNVWDGSFARALENLVYLHLRRRYDRLYYYLTRSKRREVDFIAVDNRGKPALAVQVCSDLSTPETVEREVAPLAATARYFGIPEAIVITRNEEKMLRYDGTQIAAIPAWKWLLTET